MRNYLKNLNILQWRQYKKRKKIENKFKRKHWQTKEILERLKIFKVTLWKRLNFEHCLEKVDKVTFDSKKYASTFKKLFCDLSSWFWAQNIMEEKLAFFEIYQLFINNFLCQTVQYSYYTYCPNYYYYLTCKFCVTTYPKLIYVCLTFYTAHY